MVYSIAVFTPFARQLQADLMTDLCRVVRRGTVIASNVPCRVTSNRLFAEPGDPQDANMRSMLEWGWTLPYNQDVQVGDYIEKMDGSLSTVIGDVQNFDTWKNATRAWGTRPKTATPTINITLWRWQSGLDDWSNVGSHDVQVVFDRNTPVETPLRYAQAAQSQLKGGWVIGGLTFDPQIGDHFTVNGIAAVIQSVLPDQPQRIEARFEMDISGAR